MPKTIQVESRADRLRRLVTGSKRQPAAVRDVVDDLIELVDYVKDAVDGLDSADLPSVADQLSELAGLLAPLADRGLVDREFVEELETTSAWLNTTVGDEVLDPEKFRTVGDCFDELRDRLDEYDTLQDTDRYPGRKDDMDAAWDTVVEAAGEVADALDEIGLDAEPEEADEEGP